MWYWNPEHPPPTTATRSAVGTGFCIPMISLTLVLAVGVRLIISKPPPRQTPRNSHTSSLSEELIFCIFYDDFSRRYFWLNFQLKLCRLLAGNSRRTASSTTQTLFPTIRCTYET